MGPGGGQGGGQGGGAARRLGQQGGAENAGGGGMGGAGRQGPGARAGLGKPGMAQGQGGMGPRAGMRRPLEGDEDGEASGPGERPAADVPRPRPVGAGPGMGGGNRVGGFSKADFDDDDDDDVPSVPQRLVPQAAGRIPPQGPPGVPPQPAGLMVKSTSLKQKPKPLAQGLVGDKPLNINLETATLAERLKAEDLEERLQEQARAERNKGDDKGQKQKLGKLEFREGKEHGPKEGKEHGPKQDNPGKQEKSLNQASANYVPAPAIRRAPMRARHWWLLALFVLMVVVPTVGYGYYLYAFAADQYESDVGFSSRSETATSPFSFLGALGAGGSSSSSDMDIVYEFIRSQELVQRVDAKLDLRKIYSKPANDPLMTFPKDGPIEDLVDYWQNMVTPNFDRSTGLMTLNVFAFDPKDAQDIAKMVLEESTRVINELSKTSQEDTTRYSKETLDRSEARMIAAQKALTDFRIANNILDPTSQISGNEAVINSMVQQLSSAEIELDILTGTVPDNDPRLATINRRIDVIRKRIMMEQQKVGGLADPSAPNYPKLVTEYQNLLMAQDFAQKNYLTALGAYDQAVGDAQHNTRYLATYLAPTLAESSTAPQRLLRIILTAVTGAMAWSIVTMVYYALRDRR